MSNNEPPKMLFSEEMYQSMGEGADLMASMVRNSIFDDMQMPPPEIFSWYVMNVAYRVTAERYLAIYFKEKSDPEVLKSTEMELQALQLILQKTKQLTLSAKVEDVLRISQLHYPENC